MIRPTIRPTARSMPRRVRRGFVSLSLLPLGLLCGLLCAPALAAGACEPDGLQASGAVYRICMPESWNGSLVLWAHGYVAYNEPVAIPEDQLVLPDGTSVPGLVNALGFAFATTSYAANGLVVVQGQEDLLDLVGLFTRTHGMPRRVYLVGASEGGLITALSVEKHPEVYDGGLAACGPIGDFPRQVNYDGDFRVVFDSFFPGVIPGPAIDIPQEVIDGFDPTYIDRILAAIRSDPDATAQLLRVTHASFDAADPATVEETVLGLSWYSVFATNDAVARLGGQPFDNLRRLYLGSDNDLRLNLRVERDAADPAALASMQADYQTTGRLVRPLVTLHTKGDPIIPYWHEPLYTLKTLGAGTAALHVNVPVDRYGHCNFKPGEVLLAFAVLLFKAAGQPLAGVEAVLPNPPDLQEFRAGIQAYGVAP
jgi:pimeloyl-ACP methyl ester carboxylesterase